MSVWYKQFDTEAISKRRRSLFSLLGIMSIIVNSYLLHMNQVKLHFLYY